MPISLKEFNKYDEGQGYQNNLANTILKFLKKKKKAFTSKEIAKAILDDRTKDYLINPRMNVLTNRGWVIHKRPYYSYNYKIKKKHLK